MSRWTIQSGVAPSPPALLWIALASVIAAPFGASAAHRLKVGLLRKLFAVLLMAVATKMLLNVSA
jgi:uncharacterized membrane protein YfcA